jgi:hypothetical protein
VFGTEVSLEERMASIAQLTGQRSRGVGRMTKADPDARAGGGERDGDRSPDPGAGSGDDGAQTGERRLSGLRDQWLVAGRRYPSAPPANG